MSSVAKLILSSVNSTGVVVAAICRGCRDVGLAVSLLLL